MIPVSLIMNVYLFFKSHPLKFIFPINSISFLECWLYVFTKSPLSTFFVPGAMPNTGVIEMRFLS